MPILLDHTGQPFKKRDLGTAQTADMRMLQQTFGEHPAKGLTPQRLNRLLIDAEQGNWTSQYELFRDMEERNSHLFSEIGKRKGALVSVGWEIQSPRNATPEEEKLTEQVREALYTLPNFEQVLKDLLDAIGKGFAPVEMTWDIVDGLMLPVSFEHRPQTWFVMDRETRSELRLRATGAADGVPLRPLNWIVHQHRAMSGYLAESSLYRVLTWPFVFSAFSLRDFAEFLEIHGLPIRVGKYPSMATPQEKATLLRAVTEMGHRAAGIMPDQMMFELHEAANASGDPFMNMIEWAERSISKAILGGTLTSQADGKSSTNALGNVHNEVRHDILEGDGRQLASTLLTQLIAPIVHLNFGRIAVNRLPFLQFDTKPKEDIAVWSDALPKLVGVGIGVPEGWAREKLNIPDPKKGEKLLTPQAINPATPADPNAPPVKPGQPQPSNKTQQAAAATLGALFNLPGVVALKAITDGQPDPDNPTDPYSDQLAAAGVATVEGWIAKLRAITVRAAAQGMTLESLKHEYLMAFGDLDGAELEQAMGLAMATADLAGQLAVKQAAS